MEGSHVGEMVLSVGSSRRVTRVVTKPLGGHGSFSRLVGGSHVWAAERDASQALLARGAAKDLNGFGASLDTSASNVSFTYLPVYTRK